MSHEYTLIVYTSPVQGREEEFNAWYDEVHLAEFSALPGVLSGRRFQVIPAKGAGAGPSYAALYELSGEPRATLSAMNAAVKDGTMHMSDALDPASVTMTTLKAR
ncbi:MAG TPA: hypothetical protein VH478_05340 [Trebonia sp.]|jgi:hypothetical protein|nr:hypothetical protein [Trebonia sp.]